MVLKTYLIMTDSNKLRVVIIIFGIISLMFILLSSCSNTKNLYTNYPPLPTSKTDTFQLYYDFVE